MKIQCTNRLFIILLILVSAVAQIYGDTTTCNSRGSRCFLNRIQCPSECPSTNPTNPNAKVCYVNCNSPMCSRASCRNRKPNCNGPGAACLDPRFIGGDGIVFYFHGERNKHFTLVYDHNLQINARFIGLRPAGRNRDYTWIQALGILFDSYSFTVEAVKSSTWDQEVDHLKFSYNGEELAIPEGYPTLWESTRGLKIERTSNKNSVLVTLREVAEILVNVVPVTKDDDRIHNYQIPYDDCFAHLEVQFRFYSLSSEVEGVLGRTYQPDFKNPAKQGVAMPVVGGEDKYRTESLVSTECGSCAFSPGRVEGGANLMPYGTLDCTSGSGGGNGIVCRK